MTSPTSSSSEGPTDSTPDSDDPAELQGAQQRLAAAYFDAETGLFALNCVPGAGKSFVRSDLAARELLRRWERGDRTPEQYLCVLTFNRGEADSLVSDIADRVRAHIDHDLSPAGAELSPGDGESLIRRIRQAPYIGTIDGLLRSVLGDMLGDVGFDELPAIGHDAHLEYLHRKCFQALQGQAACSDALERLTDAYPAREYDAGIDDLLRSALRYRRTQQLSPAAFEDRLLETVEAVYAEGEPTDPEDITAAIARCVSPGEAETALADKDDAFLDGLISCDAALRRSWIARVEDFCTVLEAYSDTYERLSRELGIVSHLDCAYLVAEYGAEYGRQSDGERDAAQSRVLDRHGDRIETWIIDEAQDLSTIQHAALAPLVDASDRVVLAGDIRQSIYGWRDAHPELFAQALSEGTYFGIDWEHHVVETATRTYRSRPGVCQAINAIAGPVLTDPERGNLGDLDVEYPPLEAARAPTDGPSVHIAAFQSTEFPGTESYVAPMSGDGEAPKLARYLDCLLDDQDTAGVSGDESQTETSGDDVEFATDGRPPVTVLFRRRRHMAGYARAFAAEGLSVVDTSEYLFDSPAVRGVLDVAEWLVDPCSPDRTRRLITDSALNLDSLEDCFEHADWKFDAVLDEPEQDLSDRETAVLECLQALRTAVGIGPVQSPSTLVETICTRLSLWADPHDIVGTAEAQRVDNLDALAGWVDSLDAESEIPIREFVDLFTPFREQPYKGPAQAVPTGGEVDVEFKTIHQMKGDEAPIVALADLGADLWFPGASNERFVTAGDVAGLAPPETASVAPINTFPLYTGGLYSPAASTNDGESSGPSRDVGLRWVTERWHDPDGRGAATLAGHDHLQTVPRNRRAEEWRLLYVALTRARDHLIVPLPETVNSPSPPRERWLETIRECLGFDGTPMSGTYQVDVLQGDGTPQLQVGVNDVEANQIGGSEGATTSDSQPTPFAAASPVDPSALPGFVPRILRPSTLAPLLDDPDRWLLAHLQTDELHTESAEVSSTLPIDMTTVGSEEVGNVIHSVLTVALDRVVESDGGPLGDIPVESIADGVIDRHLPDIPASTADGIVQFVTSTVLQQIRTSEFWDRLTDAEAVYLEKSVPGRIRVEGVEFELDGMADIVLNHSDGSWEVVDLKIALGGLESTSRDRYRLQTHTYARLLSRYVDAPVTTRLEVFGVDRHSVIEDGGVLKPLSRDFPTLIK